MVKKRRKQMLALPAQAGKDIKTIGGIFDRWSVGVEDVIKDVFTWAKKHKFLVLISVGAVLFYRYWLAEPEDEEVEEGEY